MMRLIGLGFKHLIFLFGIWRKTYIYTLATFSRAQGVVRKNRNGDLTFGFMQKTSKFNFTIQIFKAAIII